MNQRTARLLRRYARARQVTKRSTYRRWTGLPRRERNQIRRQMTAILASYQTTVDVRNAGYRAYYGSAR